MSGWLWLLIWAGLFYFMMRFGCGAHMVHGDHGDHGGHAGHGAEGTPGMSSSAGKDPVCGMDVPSGQGYSKAYEGREYRFCSRQHLDEFEAHPGQYISSGRS